MQPRIINSRHVKHISASIDVDRNGHMERVLKVKTDLCLNASDPAYDNAAVDQLLAAVKKSLGDLYDRMEIEEA